MMTSSFEGDESEDMVEVSRRVLSKTGSPGLSVRTLKKGETKTPHSTRKVLILLAPLYSPHEWNCNRAGSIGNLGCTLRADRHGWESDFVFTLLHLVIVSIISLIDLFDPGRMASYC
jgi:hypothetical protein